MGVKSSSSLIHASVIAHMSMSSFVMSCRNGSILFTIDLEFMCASFNSFGLLGDLSNVIQVRLVKQIPLSDGVQVGLVVMN